MLTFTLVVEIKGMDDLIAALRGDLSKEEVSVLNSLLHNQGRIARRLARLDALVPNE